MSSVDRSPGDILPRDDFHEVVRNTPLVSIDLIVRSSGGTVLVGLRSNEPAKGFLFVPGGRVTKNETLAAAFKRLTEAELHERIEITEARFIGVFEHLYETNALEITGFGTHYVVLAYEINRESVPVTANDQHDGFEWLSRDDLIQDGRVHRFTRAYAGA